MVQLAKSEVKNNYLVIDTETTGVNAHTCKLLGVATNCNGDVDYRVSNGDVLSFYHLAKAYPWVGHNAKYDAIVLKQHGYILPDIYFDTIIAYYLLHIGRVKKLETIIKERFGIIKKDLVEVYNDSTGENRVNLPEEWYNKIDKEKLATYAMEDAEYTGKLYEDLAKELEKQPILKDWFYSVEMPIVNILVKMELKGVKIDRQQLTNLRVEVSKEVGILYNRLVRLAGSKDINFNSSKQLRELLCAKFKLPVVSTDKSTLQELVKREPHGFLINLLKYREYSKILSTYTASLLEDADGNDRIHTNYNQCLTNTRRFSSDSPNLQNIPTRSDLGKKIKGCFVPATGCKFLIADYSQLEPRILAHLSQDKFLINCFKNGEDIYENTANIVRKAGFKSFTRDRSKILFLALMYGKSSYGLSHDWYCSQNEAEDIIQSVFKQLSGVSAYIETVRETAFKTSGWLKSLAGLSLYVGNPHSNNKWECAEVDRKAMNYPIQASSQDILKKAIVGIYQKYNLVPVLMIHDELVFELDDKLELDEEHIIREMEHAWDLLVPLKVEYKISDKWEK